jgi:hypothetical protein
MANALEVVFSGSATGEVTGIQKFLLKEFV